MIAKRMIALFVFSCSYLMAADPLFKDLKFEDALVKADQEGKVVFVDFYTDWCGPCKLLDKTTWRDPNVIEFLNQYTIPLKINAEGKRNISSRYHIQAYPSLAYINPDGKLLSMTKGYKTSDVLMREARQILGASISLTNVANMVKGSHAENPMMRMKYGRMLLSQNRYKAAQEQLMWAWDHGVEKNDTFADVRNTFLVDDLKQLCDSFEPAKAQLSERILPLQEQVKGGNASTSAIWELVNLNKALGQGKQSLVLFDQLREKHPETARELGLAAYDHFLETKRYQDADSLQAAKARIVLDLQTYSQRNQTAANLPAKQKEASIKGNRMQLVRDMGKTYQLLLGLNRPGDAADLVSNLLKVDASNETYFVLAKNALLSGASTAEHVAQAKRVFDQAGKHSVDVVETYAGLLAANGDKKSGIKVLKTAIQEFHNPNDAARLKKCLKSIKKG